MSDVPNFINEDLENLPTKINDNVQPQNDMNEPSSYNQTPHTISKERATRSS